MVTIKIVIVQHGPFRKKEQCNEKITRRRRLNNDGHYT